VVEVVSRPHRLGGVAHAAPLLLGSWWRLMFVAIAVADDLQTSPYPVVMLLALTASSAFTTAISPVNTFVMTAGKYRFAGFIPG